MLEIVTLGRLQIGRLPFLVEWQLEAPGALVVDVDAAAARFTPVRRCTLLARNPRMTSLRLGAEER